MPVLHGNITNLNEAKYLCITYSDSFMRYFRGIWQIEHSSAAFPTGVMTENADDKLLQSH